MKPTGLTEDKSQLQKLTKEKMAQQFNMWHIAIPTHLNQRRGRNWKYLKSNLSDGKKY